MSRKWERMVEKNRKTINNSRKKQGKAQIREAGNDSAITIRGRSWMLPALLISFSLVYFFGLGGLYPHDWAFWLTGLSYLGLGMLIYLVQRPFIKISSSSITVRRFTGFRTIEAHQMEGITVHPAFLEIRLNKGRIGYSRLQHRFPMDVLNARLKEFASQNKVPLKDEG